MAGSISMLSDNLIVEAVQVALTILIIPGLIGAAAIGGNIHAFSLAAGALVNALFHFGLSWLLFPLVMRFKRRVELLVIVAAILSSRSSAHTSEIRVGTVPGCAGSL